MTGDRKTLLKRKIHRKRSELIEMMKLAGKGPKTDIIYFINLSKYIKE